MYLHSLVVVRRCGGDLPEPTDETFDVFISHAGPQKTNFAVWIRQELDHHLVSAFLDERDLQLGDKADAKMEAALALLPHRGRGASLRLPLQPLLHAEAALGTGHAAAAPDAAFRGYSKGVSASRQRSDGLPRTPASAGPALPPSGTPPALAAAALPASRSGAPPIILPIFFGTDVGELQQQQEQLLASITEPEQRERQRSDLAKVCRHTGDRLNSTAL